MGWAEHRIEEYQHGKPANWLERRMLEHANPVHYPLVLAATAGFVFGLWTHNWWWIIGSSVLALLGHVYCRTCKSGKNRRETRFHESGASTVQAH
jgi:hypothetical protein